MIRRNLVITSPTGLHLRPAGRLCETACRFDASITLICADHRVNAKSVLSVLAAGIASGEEIVLECEGPDESEAADAVAGFFADGSASV